MISEEELPGAQDLQSFIVKPRPVPVHGNPHYPLPPDYYDKNMTRAGRLAARLNALCTQSTPFELVHAWKFLRDYYLRSLPVGLLYPEWDESPPMHYQMVHDVGHYRFNIWAAPRGFAKSTILMEVMMLLALTRPNYNVLYLVSTERMCKKRVKGTLAPCLEQCSRLNDDLGVIKPAGRDRIWDTHLLRMGHNGAILECVPIRGGSLGYRPRAAFADDPEFDPQLQQIAPDLTANYESMLTNTLMPMLGRRNCMLGWSGTLLSKQCFLYYVATNRSDPRYRSWNRRLWDAEDDGLGNVLWPRRFPMEALQKEKRRLGAAAYNAQYRNAPGDPEAQKLVISPELNEYELKLPENESWPWTLDSPFKSRALLCSHRKKPGEEKPVLSERPYGETVGSMFRMILMDWARCESPSSDFICMMVIGLERGGDYNNTWWILDLVMGRWPKSNDWCAQLFALGRKWMPQYVGIEAVAAQKTLTDTASDYIASRQDTAWMPRIVPVDYPKVLSKEDRISGLEWRFLKGKVKLPRDRRGTFPFSELYHEVEGFTGVPGATHKDDAVDTLAMAQFTLYGGSVRDEEEARDPTKVDVIAELNRGETVGPTGFNLAGSLGASGLPVHMAHQRILDRYQSDADKADLRQARASALFRTPWWASRSSRGNSP